MCRVDGQAQAVTANQGTESFTLNFSANSPTRTRSAPRPPESTSRSSPEEPAHSSVLARLFLRVVLPTTDQDNTTNMNHAW